MTVLRVGVRSPAELKAFLNTEVARQSTHNRTQFADDGQRGLVNSRLAEALGDDDYRVPFLRYLFGLDSSRDMTKAQYYVLRHWLMVDQDADTPDDDDSVSAKQRIRRELTKSGILEAQRWLTEIFQQSKLF